MDVTKRNNIILSKTNNYYHVFRDDHTSNGILKDMSSLPR